ncbi:hypothetical protein D9M72_434870 [compost metagenome]
MRIEGVAILALAWHDNDKAPAGNPSKFGDRFAIVEDMFDDMGADDGVELAIRKWQVLDHRRVIFHALDPGRVVDGEVDACQALDLGIGSADPFQQNAGSAADVADAVADDACGDLAHAGFGIVRSLVNPRMAPIEVFVFACRQERRPRAKLREMRDMLAPGEARHALEQARIPEDRRYDVFDDEAYAVGCFPVHP